VVLEFESVARARQWYDSEEYRVPKQIRKGASKATSFWSKEPNGRDGVTA